MRSNIMKIIFLKEIIKKYQPCALNAGVDINYYEPVTFEELVKNNNEWYERRK